MDRDSIYELIGYKGEYNKDVKSKLRNLLKKYHPDHKRGNIEYFKLINKVKDELENGKSFYKEKNKKENINTSNEDYDYYQNKIDVFQEERVLIIDKISNQKQKIIKLFDKYNALNNNIIENNQVLCNQKDNITYLKDFKNKYIIYLASIILIITLYLINKNSWLLLLLIVIIIILSYNVINLYLQIKKITSLSNQYLLKNIQIIKEIETLKEKINDEKKRLLGLERQLNILDNDIRFYQNRINSK